MSTHVTKAGDTFLTLSRQRYGVDDGAALIMSANPGVTEPIAVGITLVIPQKPRTPAAINRQPSDGILITVDGTEFPYWTNLSLVRAIDAISTLQFEAPFDVKFRELFAPFTYRTVTLHVGRVLAFTGTVIGTDPKVAVDSRSITLECYGTPGVLTDCTAPPSLPAFEFRDSTLLQIAEAIAAPYGIQVMLEGDQGATFDLVELGAEDILHTFIARYAKTRNIVVTDTPEGWLKLHNSDPTGNPVARLEEGQMPLQSVAVKFKQREYYSDVSGMGESRYNLPATVDPRRNPFLTGVKRFYNRVFSELYGAEIPQATGGMLSRMFSDAAAYKLAIPDWLDANRNMWEPNRTVLLKAPGAMVYESYEFGIRGVEFTATPTKRTCELELMFPGAFTGKLPEKLPWLL